MKTALIGLGRIAVQLETDPYRNKPCTHAGSLIRFPKGQIKGGRRSEPGQPGFDLVGVCDHNPTKIAGFRNWWRRNAPVRAADFAAAVDHRELFARTRPEFVIIATRTDSHYTIARDAIRSGARGMLLEKPVSLNPGDARKLEQLARKHNVRVWVNFERRYHPVYRLVKRYVDQELLGPLRSIQGQVLTWPVRAAAGDQDGASGQDNLTAPIAGPLLHDAIHWLDLLLWYAGPPRKIVSRIMPSPHVPGVEDTAFVDFEYPEFQARLEAGGRRDYFEFTIQLDFEQGRIRSGNEGHFFFRSRPSKRYQHFRDLHPFTPRVPRGDASPWLALYDEIRREMADAASSPVRFDRLADAVAGMRIIQAALRRPARG